MRLVFLLLCLGLSLQSFASSESLEKKKYYYSALNEFFLETYGKQITVKNADRLEHLLFFTGIEILEDYDQDLLDKYPTSSMTSLWVPR